MATHKSVRTSFITHTGGRENILGVVITDYQDKYKYVYGKSDRASNINLLKIKVADAEEGAFILSVISDFVENYIDNGIGIPVGFDWDDAYIEYETKLAAKEEDKIAAREIMLQEKNDAKYALAQAVNDAENNVTLATGSQH